MINHLEQIITRDLQKLRQEIESYVHEDRIWHVEKNIANSAGNLCLHLVGNLKTYIGKELGNIPYVRDRDLEFSQKGLSKKDLLERIDSTIATVRQSLSTLTEDQLKNDFPVVVFKEKTSIGYMLIHIATHLDYHLGQVNYHRRLLDN